MRKLIERIQATIAAFVEQRDDLLMIVGCSDNDAPMFLKIVEDVEQATGTDGFLLFADDFRDPEPYVSVAVERLREQHKIACDWLAEQEKAPLPPLPALLDDHEVPPAERLRSAMAYSRSLLPRDGDHRMVWAMVPQAIHDRRRYLDLVGELIPREGIQPWMRGLRLVFRDEPDTVAAAPEFEGAPRLRFEEVDMGPDAIQAALVEEVEDEQLRDEERMQALLQNALVDSAHGRFDDAFVQFDVLLSHYQETENHVGQALVLNAMGDIYLRRKELEQANHHYECAVPEAIEAESAVILHSSVRNLADIAFEVRQYERAQELYDGADQLAAKLLYAEGKAQALERKGLCQEARGAMQDAVATWEQAAEFTRNLELNQVLATNLEHLARGYGRLGSRAQLQQVTQELRSLERSERSTD
jgi:tetratricopeptide (TPR) repeat protein